MPALASADTCSTPKRVCPARHAPQDRPDSRDPRQYPLPRKAHGPPMHAIIENVIAGLLVAAIIWAATRLRGRWRHKEEGE